MGTDLVASPYWEPDVHIQVGNLPDQDFAPRSFDIITAWGVMKHIRAPSSYFAAIHDLLRKGGRFIFLVPNGDSLWSRWAYMDDVPRHLHFFRRRTLKRYAERYGYRLERLVFTNDIYSRPATGRGLFRRRLLRPCRAPWEEMLVPARSITRRLIGRLGSALDYCLIHPWMEEKLGLCGNMVAVFQKRTA